MKKLLLSAALAATFASAYADDFSKIFALTYEGEAVSDGQTITVKNYYDGFVMENPEFAGMFPPAYEVVATVRATNITEEPQEFGFTLTRIKPTLDEFPSSGSAIGRFGLCYDYSDGAGTCLDIRNDKVESTADVKPIGSEEYISLKVDQADFTDMTPITLQLEMRATEDGETVASSTIYFEFTHETDITMAVDGIEAETSAAEYFTIQGVRVAEPMKGGLYIVRRGANVTKRIF